MGSPPWSESKSSRIGERPQLDPQAPLERRPRVPLTYPESPSHAGKAVGDDPPHPRARLLPGRTPASARIVAWWLMVGCDLPSGAEAEQYRSGLLALEAERQQNRS